MTQGSDQHADHPPPATEASLVDRLASRAVRLAQRLSNFPPPRWRRPLLSLGALVFVAGALIAVSQIDLAWSEVDWKWLVVVAVVGVPTTVTMNALEYRLSAELLDHRVPLLDALQVALMATAANLLPIPGGALVRVQALKTSGKTYKDAGLATGLLGIAWVGGAAVIAGVGLLVSSNVRTGALLAVAGCSALLVAAALVTRYLPQGRRVAFFGKVAAVESLSVIAGAIRLFLVLLALGEGPLPVAAGMLALANVLANVAGIFPGGLGLREVLATLLGPLGGIAAAVGFLATAVDRILGLAVYAPVALAVSRQQRRVTATSESSASS